MYKNAKFLGVTKMSQEHEIWDTSGECILMGVLCNSFWMHFPLTYDINCKWMIVLFIDFYLSEQGNNILFNGLWISTESAGGSQRLTPRADGLAHRWFMVSHTSHTFRNAWTKHDQNAPEFQEVSVNWGYLNQDELFPDPSSLSYV